MKNWLELPSDMLSAIARQLEAVADRVRFSGVCRNWSSLAKSEINYLPPNPPWLMLPEKPDSNDHEFVGAGGKERFVVELPNSRCIGSSGCWLVMLDAPRYDDVYVLNPFSRVKIDLPSMLSLDDDLVVNENGFVIKKAILSFPISQSPEFSVVAIIKRGELAYTKKGAKSWQTIEVKINHAKFVDVIFYQDKFYAVDENGVIFEFDVHSSLDEKPNPVPISNPLKYTWPKYWFRYFVEFQGQLLQLINLNDYRESIKTSGFDIFKLNFTTGRWTKLKHLGQHSIFLDDLKSVSLLATTNSTFQPNRIYSSTEILVKKWVDEKWTYIGLVCVFNLTDLVTVPYYGGPYTDPALYFEDDELYVPVWIVPTSSSQNQ